MMDILSRTRMGCGIYEHIIRTLTDWKGKINATTTKKVVVPNPFNDQKPMEVMIKRSLNYELAMHKDRTDGLPWQSVFVFAQKYYGCSGKALHDAINQDMRLHCGERYDAKLGNYVAAEQEKDDDERTKVVEATFSYFMYPKETVVPCAEATLRQVYRMIKGDFYKERTLCVRRAKDKAERDRLKGSLFCFCTFSGVFRYRRTADLIRHSGLMCIDFDHVKDLKRVKRLLLDDESFETELLFVSPSGDGVKWVIAVPTMTADEHREYYEAVCNYMEKTYGIEADRGAKDVARCCNLAWDPECYINPRLITNYEIRNTTAKLTGAERK